MKKFSQWATIALITATAVFSGGVPAMAAGDPPYCATFSDGNLYCTALPGHIYEEINVDGGRLEDFWVGTATTRTTSGYVYHRWQTATGAWTSPAKLGTLAAKNGICVTYNDDGRLELFMQGPQNEVEHIWQKTPGGGWSGFASLGGGLSSTSGVYCASLSFPSTQPPATLFKIGIVVYGTDSAWHYKRQQAINCCWPDAWS